MTGERIELIDPTVDLEGDFRAMAEEYAEAGDDRYRGLPGPAEGGFAAYVQRLRDGVAGVGLPTGYVPANTYWLVRDRSRILAASRLRHYLNEQLLAEGGHIGYDVRPSERRKGYGTRLLGLTLEKARARGMKRVMLSCVTDNVASAKIIKANGGVFENELIAPTFHRPLMRFWIEL